MVKPVVLSLSASDVTSDTGTKVQKKQPKSGRRHTIYSKVAPEEEPETETSVASSKINLKFKSQFPGVEAVFDTYAPPLGSYDFYKCYDEYLALLDEYKSEGSYEKYDALKHVWQQKMELELLNRFPWPPKLARNTFWSFGYYRDYYPTEAQIKTTMTQNLRPSLMTLFLGDAAEYGAGPKAPAPVLPVNKPHPPRRKQTDYSVIDSTAISTTEVTQLEDFSIMDGYADEEDNSKRRKSRKDSSISSFNERRDTRPSVQYIVIPSEYSLLDIDEDKKKKKNKMKGRRSVAFTYDYVADTSEDPSLDTPILPIPKKKKKKKPKRKRTKTIYETTVYNEQGSVISSEITEEINKN